MYSLIIVDDDEMIRKGVEKVIQWNELGYEVKGTFKSAVDAIEFVKYNHVDVILTDIRMPQMTGLELVKKIQELQEGIKAVIISGYGEFELAKQALRLKVEDYLLKPLGEDEINQVFLKLKKRLDKECSIEATTSYYRAVMDLTGEEKKSDKSYYMSEQRDYKQSREQIFALREEIL